MKKFCKCYDLYSSDFHFRFNSDTKQLHTFTTYLFSGLTFILFVIFMVLSFHYYIAKSVPNILQSEINEEKAQIIDLTKEHFIVAFGIEEDFDELVNFTDILFPKFTYYSSYDNITNIEIKKCSEYNLNFSENFPLNKTKDYFCFDWSNKEFGGFWNTGFIKYYSFGLYYCNNGDNYGNMNSNTCSEPLKINDILNENLWSVTFIYPYIQMNPQNRKKLYSIEYRKYSTPLSLLLQKFTNFHLGKQVINDDQNFIFSSYHNTTSWNIKEIYENFNLRKKEELSKEGASSLIYQTNFYMNTVTIYYRRSYIKLPEILAVVNSGINVVLFCFNFVCKFINELYVYKYLIKYTFEKPKNNYINKLEIEQCPPNTLRENITNQSHSFALTNIEINNLAILKDNYIKRNRTTYVTNKTKDDYVKYYYYYVCCNNNKNKALYYLKKTEEFFNNKLNIIYYIDMLRENEVVKQCILNDSQYQCLRYLKKFDVTQVNKYDYIKDKKNIQSYFNNKKENMSRIDKNILDNLIENFI